MLAVNVETNKNTKTAGFTFSWFEMSKKAGMEI